MSMRVYLDAAPVIYLVENVTPFVQPLVARLSGADVVQVCSDLTRLECRVQPLRDGQDVVLNAYDTYFATIVSEVTPLTREVLDRATAIRAQYGFRTPDAIHLAAATESQCDLFLTNDRRLARYTVIPVETLTA
jgi:predicted nucleic acid-binding protein